MGMPPVPTDSGALGVAWQPERRHKTRKNVVDSQLVTVDLGFQKGALLLDLSDEGMGVQALSKAPLGTTTSLFFDLPDTLVRVEGMGTVAWTDSSGRVGIRFSELCAGKNHLTQWLSRQNNSLAAPTAVDQMPIWPPLEQKDEVEALQREIRLQNLPREAALDLIVQRICTLTRANGAAIALDSGGGLVCVATSGNAPDIGVQINPHSGLSGECVRTGEIVRCEDTETDPRADRLVCRRLNLRSAVILPVRRQQLLGVIEVFSDLPHAFQSTDVLLLRRVTDLVLTLVTTTINPESSVPDPEAAPALPAEKKPMLLGIAEVPVHDILQPSVPLPPLPEQLALPENPAPAATPDPEVAVQTGPGLPAASGPTEAVQDEFPASPPVALKVAVAPVSTPSPAPLSPVLPEARPLAFRPETRRDEWTKLRSVSRPVYPSASARRRQTAGTDLGKLVLGLLITLALLLGVWQLYVTVAYPEDGKPATTPTPPPAPATNSPQSSAPAPPAKNVGVSSAGRKERAPGVARPTPPLAIAIQGAAPFPARSVPAPALTPTRPDTSATPPVLMVEGAQPNGAAISTLLKSAPQPEPSLASQGVAGGRLVQRFEPAYPEAARKMRVQGPVVLKAKVGRNGRVQAVQVVSGNPLLASAAMDAVRRWRYEPFRLNGQPVETDAVVTINFVLPNR